MDFSRITPAFAKAIISDGEKYLEAQLRLAIAADSRASSLAGTLTGATTAVIGGVAIATLNAASQSEFKLPLIAGGLGSAIFFGLGAAFCFWSVVPNSVAVPGTCPHDWENEVLIGKDLNACRGERASQIQQAIDENNGELEKNSERFWTGLKFAMAAPIVGVLIGWGVYASNHQPLNKATVVAKHYKAKRTSAF